MKHAVVVLGLMSVWAGYARAQTSSTIETQSAEISTTLIAPGDPQSPARDLPDAPIPVLPGRQDGPMPCPAGDGKPCALLGGRLYFRDPSHMTQHDKTWIDALRNPLMLGGLAVNVGTTVWSYRSLRACIDSHRCREGNPILGQSRTQELTVTIGITSLFYFTAAKLKQSGNGNYAFAVMAMSSAIHAFEALQAQSFH